MLGSDRYPTAPPPAHGVLDGRFPPVPMVIGLVVALVLLILVMRAVARRQVRREQEAAAERRRRLEELDKR